MPRQIAERRIRRRAASLTQDLLCAREAHDVVDGEEIGRVIKRLDKLQFMRDGFFDMRRNASRVAKFCALAGEEFEGRLRRRKPFAQLFGIIAAQFIEAETGPSRKRSVSAIACGASAEQTGHFGGCS